jgi:hypothetical protein
MNDFDLLPPSPKAKRKETVIAVRPPKKKAELNAYTDLDDREPSSVKKNLQHIFGEDAQHLVALLEENDSDSAFEKLRKRLIQSSINLIAKVEQGVHDTNGRYGVHSYNGLVQTIRELITDLQSAKDRGAIGQTIAENIMRPAFLDIGMSIMTEYANVANDMKQILSKEDYAEFRRVQISSRDRLAAQLQSQYTKMRDDTIDYLQR